MRRVNNPVGLRLAFHTDDQGGCTTRLQPEPEHQGDPGDLRGGIISALLDKAIGRIHSAACF